MVAPMLMPPPGMPPPGMMPPPGPPMMPPGPPPGMMPPPGMGGGMPPLGALPPGIDPSGLPPGMMGLMGAPQDPMAAFGPNPLIQILTNPDLLAQLMAPKELPRYREKWQEPKAPSEGDMLSKAREDQMFLNAINWRFEDNIARINMDSVGVFESYDGDVDGVWRSTAIAEEDQLLSSMVGAIPPMFESPKRHPADEDEAQAKEDFLSWMHEEHRRQHSRASFSDLDIEMVKSITRYGRIVTRTLCNFDGRPGVAPFKMRLIDPSVIFPTFGGDRGMQYATLIYRQSVGDFIGDHDDAEGKVEKKLMAMKPVGGTTGKAYKYTDQIECIEYWDCKNVAVFADGRLVKGPVEHNYGEPPFVYTVAPYGDPGFTRTPDTRHQYEQYGTVISTENADFARRGLSAHHSRFISHGQREAMFSKMATAFERWQNEAIWYQTDGTQAGTQTPDWSHAAGARNFVPDGWKILPNSTVESPIPPTTAPLLSASNEDVGRGSLSPQDIGQSGGSQQSGYAIAGLSEAGKVRLVPIIKTKEAHHARVAEQRLRFYRDWGHLLGEEGRRGVLDIPRAIPSRNENDAPFWKMTPDMIDRTGWHAVCRLVDTPDVTSLGAMANAFGLLGQQGVITREDKIRMLGLPGSRNPRQTMRDVDIETLRDMPEFKYADLLKYVNDELKDPDMATFIAKLIGKATMKEAMAMNPGMGQPPPGAGPTPGSAPAGLPGQSLPAMGQPPGTQGGRPPGGPSQGPAIGGGGMI